MDDGILLVAVLIVLLLGLISISQPVRLSTKVSKVFCIAGVPADVGGGSAPRGRGSSLGHVSGKYRGQRERPGEARRHEVHRTKKSHLKNCEPIVLSNYANFLIKLHFCSPVTGQSSTAEGNDDQINS